MTEALLVACPACNTLNRFPRDKWAAGNAGKCGQCGSALFAGRPVTLDAANFGAHTNKSDIPVLVDFWAPWCGPCRAMAPQFERAAGLLEPAVRLAKINTEDQRELASRFAIRGIPTMVLLKRGEEIARQSGAMDAATIERWTRDALGR